MSEVLPEPTGKQEWWAGFKAALNLPDGVSRAEAMRIKNVLIGPRAVMDAEAMNLAAAAIARAGSEEGQG